MKFENLTKYEQWINSQDWYQTIDLPSGLSTKGKVKTNKRIKYLNKFNFSEKSVLDIGCNSGQYCIYAKNKNASKVIGVDLNKLRIEQAQILALNEDLDINFINQSILDFNTSNTIKFDFVFCFAVITEISDIISVLNLIKNNTKKIAIIELALTRPLIYLPFNIKSFIDLFNGKKFISEIHLHKHAGWVFHPSLSFLKCFFGNDFNVSFINRGLRYDLISITKL